MSSRRKIKLPDNGSLSLIMGTGGTLDDNYSLNSNMNGRDESSNISPRTEISKKKISFEQNSTNIYESELPTW